MRALRSSVALSFLALGAALIVVPAASAQDSSATASTEPPQNDLYPATLDRNARMHPPGRRMVWTLIGL